MSKNKGCFWFIRL